METRKCGQSGLALSILGIGAWSFGGGEDDYWGPQDERDVAAVVGGALDAGVNYFDTAEGYNEGRSEESLGRALGKRRGEALIGSKVSPANCAPATLREHCEASLRRLGTDYLDLYMVHWPITDTPVDDAFATLQALQAEGKIRAIGVSNFGVKHLTEALGSVAKVGATIAADQLFYNLLSRAIEAEIQPLCRREDVGVIGYMPLQQGVLSGKYRTPDEVPPLRARTRHFRGDRSLARHGGPGAEAEVFAALDGLRQVAAGLGVSMADVALAWAMNRPGVTCTLVGIRTPGQLADNLRAASLHLPADVVAQLDLLSEPVLRQLGTNPDYWQSAENSRIA
jgi:aryl-alcohol dehydrogenase-like predicted oxidoreductase